MVNKHTVGKGSQKRQEFQIRSIYSNLGTKIMVEKEAEYFDKIRLKDMRERANVSSKSARNLPSNNPVSLESETL